MTPTIDLNADVGESPEALATGLEEEILRLVTSANIACGGHAGSQASMAVVIALALRHGVAIGAHPSYPDREGFGRIAMPMPAGELEREIASQVAELTAVARAQGAVVRHVKPHGALYNVAARDPEMARSIGRALEPWRDTIVLVGLAGSVMLEVWRRQGFRAVAEGFADRRYERDGSLRARRYPDALITDPEKASRQALQIVLERQVTSASGESVRVEAETLCVHGDTPGAVVLLQSIRAALQGAGVSIRAPDR